MIAKVIFFAGMVAIASAQYAQYNNGQYVQYPGQYAQYPGQYVRPGQYYNGYNPNAYQDTPAKYQFAYEVADDQSGDYHGQQEARDGDVVQGVYSLVEADGTRRIVEYSADANGFNAVVRKEGQANVNYAQGAYRPAAYRPAYRPNAYAPAPVAYAPAPVAYAPANYVNNPAYRNYKK